MNQQMPPAVRCPQCKLLNFSDSESCKRCGNPLPSFSVTGQANTININISMPASVAVQTTAQLRNYQPQTPQLTGEYQVQNQTGFRQWQQMNPPTPQPAAMPFYPAPNYGIWRRGTEIVMHKLAPLPPSCVKCGASIDGYSGGAFHRHKFRWHHPAVYIAAISPIIYVILAAALSHRFPLDVPLCSSHAKTRQGAGQALGIAGLVCVSTIFLSFWAGWIGIGILAFLGALVGLSLYHEYFYKALQVSRVEGEIAFIKGADESYLRQLPYC